jgi:hypothetical protein
MYDHFGYLFGICFRIKLHNLVSCLLIETQITSVNRTDVYFVLFYFILFCPGFIKSCFEIMVLLIYYEKFMFLLTNVHVIKIVWIYSPVN